MTEIIIIAAVAKNGVIGKDNKMPWNLEMKEDLERFKKLTLDHTIIMGRKTFESLPFKPLPKRKNIVITSKGIEGYEDKIKTFKSLKEAIDYSKSIGEKKIFLIGGKMIYEEGLRYADSLELTKINKDYDGDTFFPEFDKKIWKLTHKEDKGEYSFNQYKKNYLKNSF